MTNHPKASILVVDDTPGKLVAVESLLAPLGQNVVTAVSGRDALRHLLRDEFALILLDVRMGDMDGLETAALIRQRRQSEHTPIIFMTAFEEAELDLARGYSLGAVDYIFLPIVPEILRAKVSVFVELHQKTREVRELYAAAQESSRSKSEFLNMAAHELRTPLSVVAGYLAMLAEGALGEAPEGWAMPLEMLNSKTAELNKIVDDLLLASRMDVNSLPDRLAVFDLRDSVAMAVKRAEPRCTLMKAEMTTDGPEEAILVEADPDHVGRILDNLINNALTYCTQKPRLHLSVSTADVPSVVVRDNGIGIAPEKREAVFERFIRLDDDAVGPVPGTGLGLYISRELARRHGGSLELVDSAPGTGSTFNLTLPRAETATPSPDSAQPSSNGRPKLRIHNGGSSSPSDVPLARAAGDRARGGRHTAT